MRMLRNRAGTTLTELMIVLVVMSIVGAGMVRLMSSQSRFFNDQEGSASARRVARSSLGLLFSDLRRVEPDSGIIAADPVMLSVRLPYWVGISCGPDAGLSGDHIAMPPLDSLTRAEAGYGGYGFIDAGGVPHFRSSGSFVNGDASVCTAAGVDVVVHPRARVMQVKPASMSMPVGTPVFVWQTVTYSFTSSSSVPGSVGLFRAIGTGAAEEIAAPLDNSAAFAYYVDGSSVPVSNPTSTDLILGVELHLIGLNERNTTNGQTQRAPFETALYFKNR